MRVSIRSTFGKVLPSSAGRSANFNVSSRATSSQPQSSSRQTFCDQLTVPLAARSTVLSYWSGRWMGRGIYIIGRIRPFISLQNPRHERRARRPIGDLTCLPLLQSYPTSSTPPTPLHNRVHGYTVPVLCCRFQCCCHSVTQDPKGRSLAVSTYVVPLHCIFTLSGSRTSSHLPVRHCICHGVAQYPTACFRGHRVGHFRCAIVSIQGKRIGAIVCQSLLL